VVAAANEVGAFSMCKPRLLAVIVTIQRCFYGHGSFAVTTCLRTCDPELTCRQSYATTENPKPVLTGDSDPVLYNSPAPQRG
jgi:hypothetical protein